jgi:hypothetical protein
VEGEAMRHVIKPTRYSNVFDLSGHVLDSRFRGNDALMVFPRHSSRFRGNDAFKRDAVHRSEVVLDPRFRGDDALMVFPRHSRESGNPGKSGFVQHRAKQKPLSSSGLRSILVRYGAFLLPFLLAACSGFGNTVKETSSTVAQGVKKTASAVAQTVKESPGPSAGVVGGALMVQKLGYLKPEYIAGSLIAYSIYDPFAPTWEIRVTELDAGYCRIDLNMKRLTTGGGGEARQTFLRAVRALVAKGGYAGFDELRYEEGIDSTRPFAHRVASGEVRLVKSRQFPGM